MPELPEVENVRQKLKASVVNKKIVDSSIYAPRIIRTPDLKEFQDKIKNQVIVDIDRKGKHLIFILNDYVIVSHLRMEGKYEFTHKDQEKNKHDHVIFHFENGEELRYNDVRKFGTMDLVLHTQEVKSVAELGVEPLDESLTPNYLKDSLSTKKTTIKQALLDQHIVSGLGNIYVDEVLFSAFIHPERLASSLSKKECELLCVSIKEIISLAIEKGGSSVRSYDSMGEKGSMQSLHQVYNKKGIPCNRCQTFIEKTKVAGRGTHFCPTCQK